MRVFPVVLTFMVIIVITYAKKSHKKKQIQYQKESWTRNSGSAKASKKGPVDFKKQKSFLKRNKMKKVKLEHLMPVVNSPNSPYKEEWKRITQYQEGKESLECQKLRCKKKEVCLLDKDTQVAKCIHKKQLKRAKKLVKKFYQKHKNSKAVKSKKSPELGPMQVHKKDMSKKNKSKRQERKKMKMQKPTKFDQIGEHSFHSDFVEGKRANDPQKISTNGNEIADSAVKDISTVCGEQELKEMSQRLADWFYTVQQSVDPHNKLEKLKGNLLIQKPKKRGDRKHGKEHKAHKGKDRHRRRKARDVSDALQRECECRDPVTWEFLHLDTNNDSVLSIGELKDLESNPFEHCLKRFVHQCDLDGSLDLSYPEWCCCFTNYLPPCFSSLRDLPTQMIRGQVIIVPGVSVPRCTAQGFFAKQQCDQNGQCWCVDYLGTERVGTRKLGKVKCE